MEIHRYKLLRKYKQSKRNLMILGWTLFAEDAVITACYLLFNGKQAKTNLRAVLGGGANFSTIKPSTCTADYEQQKENSKST